MGDVVEVKANQIWQDNDMRHGARMVLVMGPVEGDRVSHATCSDLGKVTGKPMSSNIKRFGKKSAGGFTFIRDIEPNV